MESGAVFAVEWPKEPPHGGSEPPTAGFFLNPSDSCPFVFIRGFLLRGSGEDAPGAGVAMWLPAAGEILIAHCRNSTTIIGH